MHGDDSFECAIEVPPLGPADVEHPHFLVLFRRDAPPPARRPWRRRRRRRRRGPVRATGRGAAKRRCGCGTSFDDQGDAAGDHRGARIDERGARAANEEIQSSNEELQSTNEELETAKEELQSTNEELTTLNDELENRNTELDEAVRDLFNFSNSIDIPIVMLDQELRIRMFTPVSERVLGLRPADVNRPVVELSLGLPLATWPAGPPRHRDAQRERAGSCTARTAASIRCGSAPIRTADDKIGGAVVALIDVTESVRKE